MRVCFRFSSLFRFLCWRTHTISSMLARIILMVVFATVAIDLRAQAIVSIAMGTGFNQCTGYCYITVIIQSSTILTSESSSGNQNRFPEIQQRYQVNSLDFTELVARVGNLSAWQSVPAQIGCPDCDGQGFEWLSVITDAPLKYSVTFEYNSTIPGFESFVDFARNIREEYFPLSDGTRCTCAAASWNGDWQANFI